MFKSITVNPPRSVEPSASGQLVFSVRPDIRLALLWLGAPLVSIGMGALVLLLPLGESVAFGGVVGSVWIFGAGVYYGVRTLVRFLFSRYTLTTLGVEARIGIFDRFVRRIPLVYVRDITHRQNLLQSLFGTSNITIKTTNGDRIELENVADAERLVEELWGLIMLHSPSNRRAVLESNKTGRSHAIYGT